MEGELDKHCKLLSDMTSLSYDLGNQLTASEREKIAKDRESIKSRLDSLTNGKLMLGLQAKSHVCVCARSKPLGKLWLMKLKNSKSVHSS